MKRKVHPAPCKSSIPLWKVKRAVKKVVEARNPPNPDRRVV